MDPAALRYVLAIDRAAIENTPSDEIRPVQLQRWRLRAQRLAEIEGREVGAVIDDLRERAQRLAAEKRHEVILELARDLAVCRALGNEVGPPWQRRLERLVEVMEMSEHALRDKVERLASQVEVVFAS